MPDLSNLNYYTSLSTAYVDTKKNYGDGTTNPNYNQGAWVYVWNQSLNGGAGAYQRLTTNGVLTGSAAPEEIQHLAEIESDTSVQANFAGQLTLLQLASVISSAALVLGVDSAAMHLAGAFRRPQIALYGPTNPFHWRPRHDRALILTAGNPPDLPLQPRHPQHPMTDLPFAQVNAAVDYLLAGGETATTLREHL